MRFSYHAVMKTKTGALLATVALLSVQTLGDTAIHAQTPGQGVERAPPSSRVVRRWANDPAGEAVLSQGAKIALLRKKVKYVFILFQENRSFDFYFGTYPGADGLFSRPAAETAGFIQPIVNVDGSVGTISPFKMPVSVVDVNGKTVPIYPTDIASVNHSHVSLGAKLNLDKDAMARNDRYALTEEGITLKDGKPSRYPTLERKQYGELVMAHVDCDVAPFLWQYADRFTLFDHFFDTVIGPSGPNAIAMIAGQSGQTEWMFHPSLAEPKDGSALPLVANPHPYYNLPLDAAGLPAKPTLNTEKLHAPNLTFASLPLSFMGDAIEATVAADYNPAFDLMDVKEDIKKIAGHGMPAVNWGWYQQGYDREPTDPVGIATHRNYVVHHNAPQYFGYVADNPLASSHMHGLGEFFTDVAARKLPASGVFYVRGGSGNIQGFAPADPNPRLAHVFDGNDDHPGYSDSGISEALLAEEINAIAASPYWKDSVIMIAYDESDGLYDHAQPHVRSYTAAGLPMNLGPRIPFMLISPYGRAHAISHEPTEHSSIIKFVNQIFNLIPLADLPDEERAREIGRVKYGQKDLGPADDKVEGVGDLLSGFDNDRLLGKKRLLPASYAQIAPEVVRTFPHMGGQGCRALKIVPTDLGREGLVPPDFNPRPNNSPGDPRSGTWVP